MAPTVKISFDGVSRGALAAARQTSDGIRGVGAAAEETERRVSASAGRMSRAFDVALGFAIAKAGQHVLELGTNAITAGISFDDLKERANIAFTTMLGSGGKAHAMLNDLAKLAESTPFQFQDLTMAAQRLLGVGLAAKNVIPTMRAVGDAVAGIGGGRDEIEKTTRAIGQIQSKGRLMAEEMMQLNEAGVFSWRDLAREIGTSVPKAMSLVTAGAVSSDRFLAAFIDNANTRFKGMTETQSHTFSGLWSTIHDRYSRISGRVLEPFFKRIEAGMERIVDLTGRPEFTAGVERFAKVMDEKVDRAVKVTVGFFHDHWDEIKDGFRTGADAAGAFASKVERVARAAQGVADAVGGWDNVMSVAFIGKMAGRLAPLIGVGKLGGGGLLGAEAAAAGLSARLASLAKLGAISVGIDLVLNPPKFAQRYSGSKGWGNLWHDVMGALGFGSDAPKAPPPPTRSEREASTRAAMTPSATDARLAQTVVSYASSQLGIPYSWGGGHGVATGPSMGSPHSYGGGPARVGLDCSGLIIQAYRRIGIELPGTSQGMLKAGIEVSRDELQPGDLVVTNGGAHVVLYIGNGQVIAASSSAGKVVIQPLDAFDVVPGGFRRILREYDASAVDDTVKNNAPPAATPPRRKVAVDDPPSKKKSRSSPSGRSASSVEYPRSIQSALDLADRPGATAAQRRAAILQALGYARAGERNAAPGSERALVWEKEVTGLLGDLHDVNEEIRKAAVAARGRVAAFNARMKARAAADARGTTGVVSAFTTDRLRGLSAAAVAELNRGREGAIASRAGLASGAAMLRALDDVESGVAIEREDKLGNITTDTAGSLRKRARAFMAVIHEETDGPKARAAVKGLEALAPRVRELVDASRQAAKDRAAAMMDALKAGVDDKRSAFAAALQTAFDRARAIFDRQTDELVKNARASIDSIEGRVTLGEGDETPAERKLREFRAKRAADETKAAEAKKRAAVADAKTDEERAAAQADLDAFLLDQQEKTLEESATAERKAADDAIKHERDRIQDERQLLRDRFDARLAEIDAGFQREPERAAYWMGQLQATLDDPTWATNFRASGDVIGQALAGGFTDALANVTAAFNALADAVGRYNQQAGRAGLPTIAPVLAPGEFQTEKPIVTINGRPVFESRPGGRGGFAAGGKVPGVFVGAEDTLYARVTPGETMIDRRLTAALERELLGGGARRGGGNRIGPIYVLGTTEREVAAALRKIVDGAPVTPSYASSRG